jgi:hypothetical protein
MQNTPEDQVEFDLNHFELEELIASANKWNQEKKVIIFKL